MPPSKRIQFTPYHDEMIRRAYMSDRRGRKETGVIATAKKLGMGSATVYRRAAELGVTRCDKLPRQSWTDQELKILEDNAHKDIEPINYALKKAGFERRSGDSIKSQLRRLGIGLREAKIDAGIYTQSELSRLMGVTTKIINNHIVAGRLKAQLRQGITQIEYNIKAKDVRQFIKDHAPNVDIVRCDKYWLIDLLTGEIK